MEPTICAPLNGQIIKSAKEKYEHLHNLPLSGTNISNGDLAVDILIGANNLWEFSTGDIKRGKGLVGRGGNHARMGAEWAHPNILKSPLILLVCTHTLHTTPQFNPNYDYQTIPP